MRAAEIRSTVTAALRAAGCVFAEEEADLLIATARDPEELGHLLERRAAGEPLEHVVGWVEFHHLRVRVDPGVFVPRRRTELLARLAVESARAVQAPVVLDLCCGSGAVGLAVQSTVSDAVLHGVDIDPAAVRCARANLALGPGTVHQGDLYAPLPPGLRGRVDVIVANAPYVPSPQIRLLPPEARLHEPRVALDGGADGLDVQRRVVAGSAGWLARRGHLLVETSRAQAEGTAALLAAAGLRVSTHTDEDSMGTVVRGIADRRREAPPHSSSSPRSMA